MVDLFPPTEGMVYLNGRFVSADEANLALTDEGVLYGLGFFETFRTSGGRPHHWSYNRRRILQACEKLDIALPQSFLARDEERLRAVVQLLLKGTKTGEAVFRYTVSGGSREEPSEFLTMRPLPPSAPSDGVAIRLLKVSRDNGEWVPRPKSLNYTNVMMGVRELERREAASTDEGLFLSREGSFVVDTTRQNIAWIAGGRLHYPDLLLGGVAGTCLTWILEQETTALPVRASYDELATAEAIFVSNAVRGVTPVQALYDATDELVCGVESSAHSFVRMLQQRWTESLRRTARS
jgi:4-amino-4-deoxychorismate lyase